MGYLKEIASKALAEKVKKYNFVLYSKNDFEVFLNNEIVSLHFYVQEPVNRWYLSIDIINSDKTYTLPSLNIMKRKKGIMVTSVYTRLKNKPPLTFDDYYLNFKDLFDFLEINYPEILKGNFLWDKEYVEY